MATTTHTPVRTWGDGDRYALLVHGITADSSSWWRVAPALAERGYRVLAPDLPGHGRAPRLDRYTLQDLADALVESVPAGPDLAIGHSLGGLLLSLVGERLKPGRVVYVEPAWNETLESTLREFRCQKEWSPAQVEEAMVRWEPEARKAKVASLAQWDPRTLDAIEGLPRRNPGPPGVPGMVVLADPSHMVPPPVARELRALDYGVRVVPRSGHVVHQDDFDGFLAAVKDWL
ncbi:alpha/beta fold hydrolase [Streptomyces sp. NPDC059398]|uniref:alpha/beta fold hydrolase n=1 Tax=Streptomyces sp. NPDC059398 TaxID=3346820 RepID=UPI0036863D7A